MATGRRIPRIMMLYDNASVGSVKKQKTMRQKAQINRKLIIRIAFCL